MVDYEVVSHTERFKGPIFSIVTDEVSLPGGDVVKRDYMRHIGAVAVVALDDDGNIVLIRQYRHPIGKVLWELPAGLIDKAGEDLVDTAARELAEECDLIAAAWSPLVELDPSPGVSNERIHLFLARGLSAAPESYARHHEEAGLTVHRIPVTEAVAMVFRREVTNASAVAGILAAAHLS